MLLKLFLGVTFFTSIAPAQEAGRILGIVTCSATGDSLKDVSISIVNTTLSALSNAKGAYLITNAPVGSQRVIFARFGYRADTLGCEVVPDQYTRLDGRLTPAAPPGRALADSHFVAPAPALSQPGGQNIDLMAVERTAGAFADLHRIVGHLGGSMGSGDYTSAYSVRGGLPDHNRVYLDGLNLPNPYRLRLLFGGGFSLLNWATINSAQFYTGFFPGYYGDLLSSVLAIDSRDGRRDRFGAGGSFDLFQNELLFEGPFPGKRGSWLASARRSYVDALVNPFLDDQRLPYMFDFDSKLVYDLSESSQISYKMLYEDEAAQLIAETDEDIEVGERAKLNMHMLALESQVSERSNIAVRASYYDQTFDYSLYADRSDPAGAFQDFASRLQGVNILQTFSLEFDDHRLAQGFVFSSETAQLDLRANTVNIGFTRRDLPPPMQVENESVNVAAYVDYSADLTQQLESTVGVRYDHRELYEQDDVSGKVSLAYHFAPDAKVYAYWGLLHQSPDLLAAYIRDVPLNMQNAAQLTSERAMHYILGFDRSWSAVVSTRLELYYKSLTRLLLPQDRVTFLPLNSGEGYAQGVDFTLEKTRGADGRLSALLTYSYGKSQVRDTRDGVWIPGNYDRRHGLSATMDFAISDNWGVNAVWRYNSGLPYNDISGYTWHAYDRSRYEKSTQNDDRYPPYSRVDLRLYYHSPWRKSRLMVYLDIVNLLNQSNIYERMYYTDDVDNRDGSKTKTFKYANIYAMPFIPSIGLSIWY
ncbi:TonB-dependent receptor [candidate division KSB1 bacterium]|nr:TonB-dependent receptor [candidate division KSB1 bacterium]